MGACLPRSIGTRLQKILFAFFRLSHLLVPGEGDDDGHVGGEPEGAQRRQVGGGGDPRPGGEVGVLGVGPVGGGGGGVGVGGRGVVVAEAAGLGGHGDGGGVCLL